jgi:hypothetical protein
MSICLIIVDNKLEVVQVVSVRTLHVVIFSTLKLGMQLWDILFPIVLGIIYS